MTVRLPGRRSLTSRKPAVEPWGPSLLELPSPTADRLPVFKLMAESTAPAAACRRALFCAKTEDYSSRAKASSQRSYKRPITQRGSPRLPTARRLFEKASPTTHHTFLAAGQEQLRAAFRDKWSFDVVKGAPVQDGRFQWSDP